jgi:hypothetical protein
MLNKVIMGLMNWLATAVLLPVFYFVYDKYRISKENKELKKVIEGLQIAKSKEDIDRNIDLLP